MAHVPQLISDLALILCSAGVVTLLFKKLNQPLVLGYIIAGLLVGPNFNLFPTITELSSIQIWAEIGVIFLLFSLGLEFSFKKLVKVGSTSLITGLFEVTSMLVIGYFAGQLMGWGKMDSLFLGGIIAISSTTIIFRAFDELGLKTKKFAGIVIGVLVIEDLVAVLLMVLLSTLAVSRKFEGVEMIASVLKLVFFLVLWFLAGIFLLPTFLRKAGKSISDETMLIIAISLCLLMVILAAQVGFSAALGAFVMGSILAETTQAERIEHVVKSVKDLFGAVFFVSVGMLINPAILVEYAIPVCVLTLAVMIGKTLNVSIGGLIAGQPLKQSIQAGTSMSQIGEFSFIIATLGITLNVTSDFLYPIAVGVSVITTFCTPYMIKFSGPLHNAIERMLPKKWVQALNRYSTGAQHIQAESHWKNVLQSFAQIVLINAVVIIAIILFFTRVIEPLVLISGFWGTVLTAVMALICISPFLWMLTVKKINKPSYTQLWLNKYNRGPIIVMEIVRVAFAVLLVGFLFDQLFSAFTALFVAIAVIFVSAVIFSRKLHSFSVRIEQRFLTNLNSREAASENDKIKSPVEELLPWDAHLAYFDIDIESDLIGKPLMELGLRETYGINIALIERGNRTILVPGKEQQLFPYDRIAVIGTDEQLAVFKSAVEAAKSQAPMPAMDLKSATTLTQITVEPGFPFLGKTIRESGIREKVNCLIVGIERDGKRILNPDSTLRFELNDNLWIVGHKKQVKELLVRSNPLPTKL
jgi:CPA2 family monovalent cation:H+ antiporter-2